MLYSNVNGYIYGVILMKTIKNVYKYLFIASFLATAPVAKADVNIAYFLEWSLPFQVAKVEKRYEEAMGEKINWKIYNSGWEIAKAMTKGDIDIAFSMGMAPFVTAVNRNMPIKMVATAVVYDASEDCITRNATGITKDNIKELEGKRVAVPFNTSAEFVFRMTMLHLGVDVSKIEVLNRPPADAAYMMLETEVDAACTFGKNSLSKMKRVGKPILSSAEKKAAGINNISIISTTENFAQKKAETLRQFLKVTSEANKEFARDSSKIHVIAKDAGLTIEGSKAQMADFQFPAVEEQLNVYFSKDGRAMRLLPFMGKMFATDEFPEKSDYSKYIDTSFLK